MTYSDKFDFFSHLAVWSQPGGVTEGARNCDCEAWLSKDCVRCACKIQHLQNSHSIQRQRIHISNEIKKRDGLRISCKFMFVVLLQIVQCLKTCYCWRGKIEIEFVTGLES